MSHGFSMLGKWIKSSLGAAPRTKGVYQ